MAQGPHVGSNHLATRLEREKGKEERRDDAMAAGRQALAEPHGGQGGLRPPLSWISFKGSI